MTVSGLPRSQLTLTYIYGLSITALAVLASWVGHFGLDFNWTALVVSCILSVVCALTRRFPVKFGRVTVEIVEVAIITALALLGPVWALLVAVPAMFYREHLRSVYTAATYVLILSAGGLAFRLFTEPLLLISRFDLSSVYAILAAGLIYHVLDALINCLLLRFKYGTPVMETLRDCILPCTPSDLTVVLTVIATSCTVATFGPAAALVLFGGATAAIISLHLIKGWRDQIQELGERVEALEKENADALSSPVKFASRLVESVGEKDGHTSRRAAASAVYVGDLAREFRLDSRTIQKLELAALLQDVGLVSVPEEVLLAPPERLNRRGREHLESHPAHGERILAGIEGFDDVARWVRWHHERVDGRGYPDGLRGEWLPLEVKILATAASYAEMMVGTAYRGPLLPEEARRKLAQEAGRVYDGLVVRTLLRLMDQKGEEYASASGERFVAGTEPDIRGRAEGFPHLRAVESAE
ncbi:HD-GYP domain-containing protein [Rubrobacter calidifluminis]|uniref:HD-GYP domain-containing protein n=1 Tax=Rubrobacter calidifluminis TaxID=1392640 RepID=UPI00235FAF55|nr:HD domain-containing phosphohydrolase [Rubrobacter calidifluminis]